ncbi:MAG: hypothetical protein JSR62_17070 [Nitrospira sp.]|nr:hypothetical protein [Nitrospira sp.]
MRYPVMRRWCILLSFAGLPNPAVAETLQERVALSLSGPDCSAQHPSIVAALTRIPGVARVDVQSVPEHALVDVQSGAIGPDELREAASRALTASRRCQIEIMKSCITADQLSAHP